jgi:sulfur transfer complex TusBCD TusB component (DsrH family)
MNIKNMSYKITTQKETDLKRKCFYYEDSNEQPILAAGVLFIKEEKGKKFVLMQKKIEKDKTDEYSDFGGKIDLDDDAIVDTIARELGEELNKGLYKKVKKENIYLDTTEELKNLILQNILKLIYQRTAKYFVIIAKLPKDIMLDFEKIGTREELDKINRTVEWISYEDFIRLYNGTKSIPNQIHPRLWGGQIKNFFTPKKFGFSKTT